MVDAVLQVPNTGKEVRFKIIRNIGTAFVRMGQFQVWMELNLRLEGS